MSEIVKASVGELILPNPANEAAAFVVKKLPAIVQQLPQTVQAAAWAAATMAELNTVAKECTVGSVAKACWNLAYLGLFPGGILGHAYFVPLRNKRKQCVELNLWIGYRGYIDLAYSSGFLQDVHCDTILRGEEFKYWKDETGPRLNHVPEFTDRNPTRENITGAYCLYHTQTGGKGIRVVPRKEIDRVDKREDVWNTDFAAQCMKTAVRRAYREWKLTGRCAHALAIDESADRDEEQPLPTTLVDAIGDATDAEKFQLPTE